MARQELKTSIDLLFTEKSNIDKRMTETVDKYNLYAQKLQNLRNEQAGYRESKMTLSTNNMNKPARAVFDANIARVQKEIEEVIKLLDAVEVDRVVWSSRSKSIEKSIRELQSA